MLGLCSACPGALGRFQVRAFQSMTEGLGSPVQSRLLESRCMLAEHTGPAGGFN